jgi:hypothetical protein
VNAVLRNPLVSVAAPLYDCAGDRLEVGSLLVPKRNIEYNRYWDGFSGWYSIDRGSQFLRRYYRDKRRRPFDRRQEPYSTASRARARLGRFQKRTRWGNNKDPREPKKKLWGESLDIHLKHLGHELAMTLRLQMIHEASSASATETVMWEGGEGSVVVKAQRCRYCDELLPSSRRFIAVPYDLLDDHNCWREGTRFLERLEGPYKDDLQWWVLFSKEDPPQGFIPCRAALERIG